MRRLHRLPPLTPPPTPPRKAAVRTSIPDDPPTIAVPRAVLEPPSAMAVPPSGSLEEDTESRPIDDLLLEASRRLEEEPWPEEDSQTLAAPPRERASSGDSDPLPLQRRRFPASLAVEAESSPPSTLRRESDPVESDDGSGPRIRPSPLALLAAPERYGSEPYAARPNAYESPRHGPGIGRVYDASAPPSSVPAPHGPTARAIPTPMMGSGASYPGASSYPPASSYPTPYAPYPQDSSYGSGAYAPGASHASYPARSPVPYAASSSYPSHVASYAANPAHAQMHGPAPAGVPFATAAASPQALQPAAQGFPPPAPAAGWGRPEGFAAQTPAAVSQHPRAPRSASASIHVTMGTPVRAGSIAEQPAAGQGKFVWFVAGAAFGVAFAVLASSLVARFGREAEAPTPSVTAPVAAGASPVLSAWPASTAVSTQPSATAKPPVGAPPTEDKLAPPAAPPPAPSTSSAPSAPAPSVSAVPAASAVTPPPSSVPVAALPAASPPERHTSRSRGSNSRRSSSQASSTASRASASADAPAPASATASAAPATASASAPAPAPSPAPSDADLLGAALKP